VDFLNKLLDGVAVEWTALGEATKVLRGKRLTKSQLVDGASYPVFHGGLEPLGYYVESNRPAHSVMVINVGASAGTVGYSAVDFWSSDGCFCLEHSELLNGRFLYFAVIGHQNFLRSKVRVAGIPTLDAPVLEKIQIPIPCPDNPKKSLEIQAKIVRILDAFTELKTELTTELTTRKKQYNHYRDQLLSFEDGAVEWKTLLEACDYVDYRGKTPAKTTDGVFLVTAKNIRMGYIDYQASEEFISADDYASVMRRGLPKIGDVLITTEAPCGFVAQVDRDNIALAQRVIKYRSRDASLSNSFLKHYLLGSQFQDKLLQAATGSTVKGIKGSTLHQLTIPIPSVTEQNRIVAILDKFDVLTNSITEGLPREIELRQKQYEHYRDVLLSFPKPQEVVA
jgi:type I restriction enzyme S subunit